MLPLSQTESKQVPLIHLLREDDVVYLIHRKQIGLEYDIISPGRNNVFPHRSRHLSLHFFKLDRYLL